MNTAHRRGKLTFLQSSHSQLPFTPGSGLWPPPMAVAVTAAGSPNSWQFCTQNQALRSLVQQLDFFIEAKCKWLWSSSPLNGMHKKRGTHTRKKSLGLSLKSSKHTPGQPIFPCEPNKLPMAPGVLPCPPTELPSRLLRDIPGPEFIARLPRPPEPEVIPTLVATPT